MAATFTALDTGSRAPTAASSPSAAPSIYGSMGGHPLNAPDGRHRGDLTRRPTRGPGDARPETPSGPEHRDSPAFQPPGCCEADRLVRSPARGSPEGHTRLRLPQGCGLSWAAPRADRGPTAGPTGGPTGGPAAGHRPSTHMAPPRKGRLMTGSTGGFELRGINHLALVCRDMERTVDFYTNVLGMPLVKTIELPAGHGPALLLRLRRRRLPRLLLVPRRARWRAGHQRAGGPPRPG